jgi:hypothetical protein
VNLSLLSHLLDIEVELIAGYRGSREATLAVIRGEADLSSYNFESVLDRIESGELVPLLQSSFEPLTSHPSLVGLPCLAGPDGFAVRRARALGRDVKQAELDAAATVDLVSTGLMVVAPPAIEPSLSRCLRDTLLASLRDPALVAAAASARRPLDVAGAEQAMAEIKAATVSARRFLPLVRSTLERLRG